MAAPKVSLYSLTDLKTTLDDHIPTYLTSPNLLSNSTSPLPASLRFKQSNYHTYVRLALGYTAVSLAAYLFYLDWYLKVPFSSHKRIAAPLVLLYFLLNGALQVWIWFGERGVVFSGSQRGKSGDGGGVTTLVLHSRQPHKKYDPVYRLAVTAEKGGRVVGKKEQEISAPFTRFFAVDGTFMAGEFETWLRENVTVLDGAGGSVTAAAAPAKPAVSSPAPVIDAKTVEVDEEEDAVLVDASLVNSVQASGREGVDAPTGGKKRSKKKA